jgi:hypothetical protein
MEATDFGCDERFMRLLKLDASLLVHPTLQHSSRLSILIGSKDERENRRQQECDGEERSNDQDATALGRCEELAGSAAKGRELRRGQPCFSGVSLASPGADLASPGARPCVRCCQRLRSSNVLSFDDSENIPLAVVMPRVI